MPYLPNHQDADRIVRKFRDFLVLAWEAFQDCLQTADDYLQEELTHDWLQVNWEILVEQMLCAPNEYLEAYRDGAEVYGLSERVIYPNAITTHQIRCKAQTGHLVEDQFTGTWIDPRPLTFERFATKGQGQYLEQAPFDHVLLRDGNELYLVEATAVCFEVLPYRE